MTKMNYYMVVPYLNENVDSDNQSKDKKDIAILIQKAMNTNSFKNDEELKKLLRSVFVSQDLMSATDDVTICFSSCGRTQLIYVNFGYKRESLRFFARCMDLSTLKERVAFELSEVFVNKRKQLRTQLKSIIPSVLIEDIDKYLDWRI